MRFSLNSSSQIYDVVQRQPAEPQERRESIRKQMQIFEENPNETHLEFSAVTYAILEHEGQVEVLIKRTGRLDQTVRFRCLFFDQQKPNKSIGSAHAHLNLHDIARRDSSSLLSFIQPFYFNCF